MFDFLFSLVAAGLLSISGLLGFNQEPTLQGVSVFKSSQVGTSPVDGYYLQTDGVNSIWAAVSGGSGASTTLLADNNTFSGNNTFSNTISGSISGNAGTASVLAANAANCAAGSGAGGVSASGAAEDCTDYEQNLTAGDALTRTGDDFDFDGGATPSGDLSGTWASPSVTDDSHAHTGSTISGLDISADTNLAVTYPIILTDDTLSFPATSTLYGTGTQGQVLGWDGAKIVWVATSTSGASSFAYPFPSDATSTLLTFNGGILSTASSTVNSTLVVTGNLTNSTLTSGRVPFIGAAGLFTDEADFTYSTAANRLVAATIQADNAFEAPSGSASTGGIYFTSDTNTGVFRESADVLGITTGGISSLLINNASSTINSNLTINGNSTTTSATTTNLHVSNAINFNGVSGTTWAAFCQSITGGSGLCDGNDASGGGSAVIATSTNETKGRLPYWTTTSGTPATLGEVATSSVTINAPLTSAGTPGAVVGGSGWSLDVATTTNSLFTGTAGQVLAYTADGWTGVATTTFSSGLTYSGGNVTADLGTSITAAEIANGDHGDFTYSGGSATLDADTVADSEIDYANVTLNDFTNDANFADGTGFAGMVAGWLDTNTLEATSSPRFHNLIATSTTATSSIAGDFFVGASTGDNKVRITADRVFSASNSVGGLLNLTNTSNTGPALVAYTNQASSAGNLANFRCDNATMSHDCVKIDHDGTGDGLAIAATAAASNALSLSNSGVDHTLNIAYTGSTAQKGGFNVTSTNTTGSVFQVAGPPTGLGVGKITHNGVGDADSSVLSLAASDTGYLGQGIFADIETVNGSQKVLNLRTDGTERFTVNSAGFASTTMLWAHNASSTNATTTNQHITGLATPAGAFLAVDPNGRVIATTTPVGGSSFGYPFSLQTYEALYQATSSRLYASSTRADNATTTNATTTNLNISGQLDVDGLTSALVLTGSTGIAAEYAGTSCTNQFVRSLDAVGAATCATVGATDVSLANLTATDSTLTFSGTYNGSTARTIGLTLSNGNVWTAASTTFNGGVTIVNATTTNATSTNLNVSGQVDFDQLTSALVLTGAGGILAEYAGTSCTNQVTTALSALGAATCSSINDAYWSGTDLTVANGGTGVSTFTSSQLLYGNGTNALSSVATSSFAVSSFPANYSGTFGAFVGGTGGTWTWWGVSTSTALANTQITYSTAANTIGSEAAFTYNSSTDVLTAVNGVFTTSTSTNLYAVTSLGVATSSPGKALGVTGEALISATTTTAGLNVLAPTVGTSTVYMYSKTAGFGGRIILEDVDAAGCTEVTALNGVLTAAIVTCPTEF